MVDVLHVQKAITHDLMVNVHHVLNGMVLVRMAVNLMKKKVMNMAIIDLVVNMEEVVNMEVVNMEGAKILKASLVDLVHQIILIMMMST
jgi:hypothetical protein